MIKTHKLKHKKIRVAMELGKDSCPILVSAEHNGERQLRFLNCETMFLNDEETSRSLDRLFTNEALPREACLNFPRHLVMSRIMTLPSANAEEIRNMLTIEATRFMPSASEEMISGFIILDKLSDGCSRVLLVVAQASVIKKAVKILADANITPMTIGSGTESLLEWYGMVKHSPGDAGGGVTAVINASADYINMNIMDSGLLTFNRAFLKGFSSRSDEVLLAREIAMTLVIHGREQDKQIRKIIITGIPERANLLKGLLEEELKIAVEDIQQGLPVNAEVSPPEQRFSYVELIGLLLRSGPSVINLLPEEIAEQNRYIKLRKEFRIALVFIISFAMIVMAGISKKMHDKSRYLGELNSKIEELRPKIEAARRTHKDMAVMNSEIHTTPYAIEVLSEVYKAAPQSISLYLFDYETADILYLKGYGSALSDIIEFFKALQRAPDFENVALKYTAERSAASRKLVDFEISCGIKGSKK